MNLSWSQLKAYEICPQQYKLQYIDKIKTKKPREMTEGTKFHNFAENFFKRLSKFKIINEQLITEMISQAATEEEFEFVINEHKRFLRLKETNNENLFIPKFIEQKLEGKICNFPFMGFADRIDMIEDGSFKIIDYKPIEYKTKTSIKRQLLLYTLLAKDYLNIEVSEIGAYYYKSESSWSEKVKEKDLNNIKKYITKQIENIYNDNKFEKVLNQYCENCMFGPKHAKICLE